MTKKDRNSLEAISEAELQMKEYPSSPALEELEESLEECRERMNALRAEEARLRDEIAYAKNCKKVFVVSFRGTVVVLARSQEEVSRNLDLDRYLEREHITSSVRQAHKGEESPDFWEDPDRPVYELGVDGKLLCTTELSGGLTWAEVLERHG